MCAKKLNEVVRAWCVRVKRRLCCAECWGMDPQKHTQQTELKHDDVLARIAVSASELAGELQAADGSDLSEVISRVLDERRAA